MSATPPLGGWGWDSSWSPRPAPPSWRSSRGRAPRPAGSPCQGFLPPWISFHLIPWNCFHSQSWHVVSLAQKCSLWQVSVFPLPSHICFSLPVVKLTRASPTPENLDFLQKINFYWFGSKLAGDSVPGWTDPSGFQGTLPWPGAPLPWQTSSRPPAAQTSSHFDSQWATEVLTLEMWLSLSQTSYFRCVCSPKVFGNR